MATRVGREKGEAISMFSSSRDKQSIIIIIMVKGKQMLCYTKEGIILETSVHLSVYCSTLVTGWDVLNINRGQEKQIFHHA